MVEWDTNTRYADKFAFKGNFVYKVYGNNYHQLVAKDPLKGSTTIKATIKKYSDIGFYGEIAFGLFTESRRNALWSGGYGDDHQ